MDRKRALDIVTKLATDGEFVTRRDARDASEFFLDELRTKMFLRPALLTFAEHMEAKLRKNDHKTEADRIATHHLVRRLRNEVEEFEMACEVETPHKAALEAVDVANFALFLFRRKMKEHLNERTSTRPAVDQSTLPPVQ